jgi:hypothetical protein
MIKLLLLLLFLTTFLEEISWQMPRKQSQKKKNQQYKRKHRILKRKRDQNTTETFNRRTRKKFTEHEALIKHQLLQKERKKYFEKHLHSFRTEFNKNDSTRKQNERQIIKNKDNYQRNKLIKKITMINEEKYKALMPHSFDKLKTTDLPSHPFSTGPMNVKCEHCPAVFFKGELLTNGKVPSLCCNHGKFQLPDIQPLPKLLFDLLTQQDKLSKVTFTTSKIQKNVSFYSKSHSTNCSFPIFIVLFF